jgi:hypothetical protein
MFARQICFVAQTVSLSTVKFIKIRIVLPRQPFNRFQSSTSTQSTSESFDNILQTYKSQYGTDIIINSDIKHDLKKIFAQMSSQVVAIVNILPFFFQLIDKIVTTDKSLLPSILRNPEMTNAILSLQFPHDITSRFVFQFFFFYIIFQRSCLFVVD